VKSRRSRDFNRDFDRLPAEVKAQARAAYRLFERNPYHPSLQFKFVGTQTTAWSVRIGRSYRAMGMRRSDQSEDTVVWFWIGSHAEYDELLRRL
jgi:hypothetical protein